MGQDGEAETPPWETRRTPFSNLILYQDRFLSEPPTKFHWNHTLLPLFVFETIGVVLATVEGGRVFTLARQTIFFGPDQ